MVKQKIFQKNLMLVVTMLNLLAFQSSSLAASGLIGSAAPYFSPFLPTGRVIDLKSK
jgi:hypothetical protein